MADAPRPAGSAAPQESAARTADDGAGRTFLQALYAASRLSAMWGMESRLTVEALDALDAAVHGAAAQGEVVLRFVNDLAYVGEQRLRVDFSGYTAFHHLQSRAARHGIGELSISAGASRHDVATLLTTLESKPGEGVTPDDAFDAAKSALAAAAVSGVSIGPATESDGRRGRLGPVDSRQAAVQAYFRAVFVARRVRDAVREGRTIGPRRCKRAVHEIVDVLEKGASHMVALAQIRNYHGFEATHAANVCVLTCAAALRAGLPKLRVADAGLAALLHEPSPVDPSRTHAAALRERDDDGARLLLRELGLGDGALRAVLAVRGLHAHGDTPPLVTAIVRAVCFYDTVTTTAGPDRVAAAPAEAIERMARDPSRFDPVAVRLLASILGPYPPGTLLRLDTGETALVREPSPDPANPDRPFVRIVADAHRRTVENGPETDLSETDPTTGAPLRSVVASRAPGDTFRTPADYVRLL